MSSIFYVKPTIDDDIEENESAHPAKENNFENLSEMNNVDKASTKDSVLDNSDPNSSEEKQENVLQEKKQLPVVEESQQESQPPTAIIATSDNSMNKNPTSVETQSSDSVQKTRQKFNQASNLGNATGFPPFVKSSNKKANVEDAYDSLNVASIVLDINEKSWYIRSAQGDMVQMRRLLDKDEDLAEKKNGIHWAAKKGNLDMLKMMLDHNNEVNLRTHGGYTPLHLAAMYGHEECISLLLDYGADVNVRDYSGKKPISYLKVYSENDNETQARLPSWQRHYHSGSKHMSVISDDVYDRIEVKMITSKLDNEVVRRRRSENNMGINGKQRAKSEVFIEPKNGESGVKSGKPVRRGSSKGLWKMPSIRRSKTPSLSSIEHNVPMTTGYGKPSTPTSGAMWKPAGPKA